jgi:hypothetical protein
MNGIPVVTTSANTTSLTNDIGLVIGTDDDDDDDDDDDVRC